MRTKEELPACPVATTVQLIGSKWKLLILRNLLSRPWRFNELKKDLDGISQKVLTDSLRSLEEDGIVTRTVYPEVPPRVEYALSELGNSMRPIISAMEAWGALRIKRADTRIKWSSQAESSERGTRKQTRRAPLKRTPCRAAVRRTAGGCFLTCHAQNQFSPRFRRQTHGQIQ